MSNGILTEKDLEDALKAMWDQPRTPQMNPIWIKSSEIKKLKLYWWNPISVIRYLRTRRKVMKIIVDITKSMPIPSAYPSLSHTQAIDLIKKDPEAK